MSCPLEHELAAYGEGRLDPDRARAVAEHVAYCVACQKRLSLLAHAVTTGSSPTVMADSVPPPSGSAQPPTVGALLGGKYRVERILGQGGMGVVVEATHVGLMQRVAIKFLRSETKAIAGALDRFVREARAAAGIRSEHVVRVFDTGVFETGEPYIVMELLAGEDLRTMLARRGPLTATQAASFAIEACEALSEAHALGIVHRDLKPANLFVTARADGSLQLKVLDFGISKVYGDSGAQTTANVAMGSPLYMSPEQIQSPRDVDARADVWALGVVLYEALSLRPPFDGEGMVGIATAVITRTPPPLPVAVPQQLGATVMRCLEKDRALRFASASDLAIALRPFASPEAKLVADRIARAATPRMRSTPPPSSREAPPISGFEATVARSGSTTGWHIPRHAEIAVSIGVLLCLAGGIVLVLSLRAKHHEASVPAPETEKPMVSAPPTQDTTPVTIATMATAAASTDKPQLQPPVHGVTQVHTSKATPSATAPSVPPTATATERVDLSGALRDRK